mmetsp:Transcript_15284/g.25211  ORF Transcript_15284/g.25211 Transcript_15284/m.25211 type:complete len:209 (-) Transcript_15284:4163-4789(-)
MGQDLTRQFFVQSEVGGVVGCAILHKHSHRLGILALLHQSRSIHHRILLYCLLPLLISNFKDLLPFAAGCIEIQGSSNVPGLHQCIGLFILKQVLYVVLLHILGILRQVVGCKRTRLVPHSAHHVHVDGLLVAINAFQQLRRLLIPLDVNKPLAYNVHHLGNAFRNMIHGKLHGVLPLLLQIIQISSLLLGHPQININGSRILSTLLP